MKKKREEIKKRAASKKGEKLTIHKSIQFFTETKKTIVDLSEKNVASPR